MDIGFPTMFPGFSPRFSETGKGNESRAWASDHSSSPAVGRAAISRENAAIFWLPRPANLPLFAASATSGNSASARQRHRWRWRQRERARVFLYFRWLRCWMDGTEGTRGTDGGQYGGSRANALSTLDVNRVRWPGSHAQCQRPSRRSRNSLVTSPDRRRGNRRRCWLDATRAPHRLLYSGWKKPRSLACLEAYSVYSASNTSSISGRPRAKRIIIVLIVLAPAHVVTRNAHKISQHVRHGGFFILDIHKDWNKGCKRKGEREIYFQRIRRARASYESLARILSYLSISFI